MSSVLITGANRGLGLELARQYSAANWRIFACCRDPGNASELQEIAFASHGRCTIHALDVKNHGQMEQLADELRYESLDILLNNAGIYGPNKMYFGQLDFQAWAEVLAVNTLAPIKLAECFLEQVARSERRIFAFMSSAQGSISSNTTGRHYLYRSSKAALNAAIKSLSIDLHGRGIIAIALHPGWVRTDMGGSKADLAPAESVHGLIQLLNQLTLDHSGRFLNYDGSEISW